MPKTEAQFRLMGDCYEEALLKERSINSGLRSEINRLKQKISGLNAQIKDIPFTTAMYRAMGKRHREIAIEKRDLKAEVEGLISENLGLRSLIDDETLALFDED